MAYVKNVIVTNKTIDSDRAKEMVMTVIETLGEQENLKKSRTKVEPVVKKGGKFCNGFSCTQLLRCDKLSTIKCTASNTVHDR